MKYLTDCKKIGTAIRRSKKYLKEKAAKHGLYENFGEEEVDAIRDKFIDISDYTTEMNRKRDALNRFYEWCLTCDVNDIQKIENI